jgi:uncharacterized LabA/DUF88 family protein
MKFKPKRQRNYAFIDSQNLNLGVQKVGWKMDWRKFRAYLKDKYNVTNAYMFIGYMPEHEDIYEYMHSLGYLVVLKPTVDMNMSEDKEKSEKHTTKGNVDADLVLYAMKELPNYDKAVIVSGDGDFYGLIEYLDEKKRLQKILTPNRQYSSLLKPFEKHIVRLDQLKKQLSYYDHKRNK